MGRWLAVGTVLQLGMVLTGHWVRAVANLFGPLGVTISLLVGLLWARSHAGEYGTAARGGAMVGGGCALVGIAVSFALGDVGAVILVAGTLSSAATGALGGMAGRRLAPASGGGVSP